MKRLETELHAVLDVMDSKPMDMFSSSHRTKVEGTSAKLKED